MIDFDKGRLLGSSGPPKPVRHLVRGLVRRGKLNGLLGLTGTCKTLFTVDLAVCVASEDRDWLGRETQHGPVWFFDADEHDFDSIDSNFQRCVAGHGLVAPLKHEVRHFPIDEPIDGAEIKRIVKNIEAMELALRPILIVFDSFAFITGIDSMVAQEVVGFYRHLHRLSDLDVTTLVSDHEPRPTANDLRRPGRHHHFHGTVYKENSVDAWIGLTLGEDEPNFKTVRLAPGKTRRGALVKPFDVRVKFEDEEGVGPIVFETIETTAATMAAEEGEMGTKEEVHEWMWRMGGLVSAKEVKETWRSGAVNLLTDLSKDGKILKDGQGWWVTVAAEYPESMKTGWSEWQRVADKWGRGA